jgi:glycyl-tRNA synthetase beta chain
LTAADCFTLNVPEKRGDYAAVRKRAGGKSALELLTSICPEIISALPFAKRMRWGRSGFSYARPLRWIVALLDADVVSFTIGRIQSGRRSFGHRVHGCGPFDLAHANEYPDCMKNDAKITLDAAERRSRIREQGDALAAKIEGAILWKEGLLDEVQGLCEQPVPLLGSMDKGFLELPREVLLTSMENHQKSFGVQGADGALLPYFLAVLNMRPPDEALVRDGWERVLRARLEDARFFWKTDMASNFDTWLTALDTVIFLGPLGSMGEKARRLETLCGRLARKIAPGNAQLTQNAERAGKLCKADLVSGMVGEFDTLQGVMGGIYARKMGETEAVAVAIAEHYLPAGPDSALPETDAGALLAVADKADTLVGCFGLGLIPTGAADPNALRRCALGISRIVLERGYRLDIRELFAEAFKLYGDRSWKLEREDCLAKLEEFFGARLRTLYISQGRQSLLTEAALGADFSDVWAAGQRLAALERLSKREDFAHSVQTFKRVANIIRKQAAEMELNGQWIENLPAEPAEKALAGQLATLLPRFDELWAKDDFDALFALLQELRPAVDAFFDKVMVMCDDTALRVNRLNMLQALVQRLERLADFAALQI